MSEQRERVAELVAVERPLRLADDHGVEPAIAVGERREQGRWPGAVVRSPAGAILAVVSLEIGDDLINAIYNQINPGKLGHLGTVGNLTALQVGDG